MQLNVFTADRSGDRGGIPVVVQSRKEGTRGQSSAFSSLGAVSLLAAAESNICGKWTGSFNMIATDGQTNDSTALLVLKQTGNEITGTVGPGEDEQHAITRGKIERDKITLEAADGGLSIKLDLMLVGDRITGDVNAAGAGRALKAKLDVARAK